MSNVGSTNASDVGLIVQGTLIFLSAVVAVFGYVIQSRLSAKAHASQLKLAREERHKDAKLKELQTTLTQVVGPVQSYIQTGNYMLMSFGVRHSGLVAKKNENKNDQNGAAVPMEAMTYFPRLLGGMSGMKAFMNGELVGLSSWLLPELIDLIQQHPERSLAKEYRRCMELALTECFIPACTIIKERLNEFPFPSREVFKKRYPSYAKDGQLRKKMLIEFCDWTLTFSKIVKSEWKQGDYETVYLLNQLFPVNVNSYCIVMLDQLKEGIQARTDKTFDFNLTSTEEEYKAIKKEMASEQQQQQQRADDTNIGTSSSTGSSGVKGGTRSGVKSAQYVST